MASLSRLWAQWRLARRRQTSPALATQPLIRRGRCPDEYALHFAVAEGAIAFADGLHHEGGELGFFDDDLLGDDPEAVKRGLVEQFRALLERDFDHLLFAHGDPIVGGGKRALRAFVEQFD